MQNRTGRDLNALNHRAKSPANIATRLFLGVCLVVPSCFAQTAPWPGQDGDRKAFAAIAGAGLMENDDYEYLQELSDDIGARVTGSPEGTRAVAWGVEKMKALGLEDVHTEPWQLFRGWTRLSAEAELVAPIRRRLMVDSMGWVGSTSPGGVEAQLVVVNAYQLADEVKRNAANWSGKILLLVQKGAPPGDRRARYLRPSQSGQ